MKRFIEIGFLTGAIQLICAMGLFLWMATIAWNTPTIPHELTQLIVAGVGVIGVIANDKGRK